MLGCVSLWPQNACLKRYRVKAGCDRACSCQKIGLYCSQMCSHSLGPTCTDMQVIDIESNEDIVCIANDNELTDSTVFI